VRNTIIANASVIRTHHKASAFDFKDHSEKSAKFDPFPINRLDADSECAGGPTKQVDFDSAIPRFESWHPPRRTPVVVLAPGQRDSPYSPKLALTGGTGRD
jgi:hypothetical protein